MLASSGKHRHSGISGLHLGAGPLSLLLLPKCPLCLVPLLAMLGLAIPPAIGLWIVSGLLVTFWLAILFTAPRANRQIRVVAFGSAALCFIAIGFQMRSLLWIGVTAMAAAGFALARMCAHATECATSLTDPSPEA
jgi:hypothetical protein